MSALAALSLVVLAAAPSAGAAKGRLLVDPGRPFVGVRTSIQLHATVAAPLYVQLVSPTGVRTRLRLTRILPGLWLAAWHPTDDGQWLLRVPRAGATARVFVLQPPGALPPFNPNKAGGSTAGALSGIAGPGIVIGR